MPELQDKPAIRFAGFNDDWKQRKLSDVAQSFEYGLNAAATEFDGANKYIRITDIDDSTHEFKFDDLTTPETDLTKADNYRLHEGDILFARTGASVGKTYQYKVSDGLVYFAGFLIRTRIKPEYDSEFVFQNTLTSYYNSYISITSQRSGQPGVNAQEYGEFMLSTPKLPEQKKIGQLFATLDRLITLHQREYSKTINIKKAMLEKMFPKYGEDRPEIRFGGFTDAWEQRKLGEHTKLITKGTTPKDKSGIGEVNFVKVENIANGVITPVTKITIEEHDGDLQRSKLKENDVLFSIAGTLGRIAIVDKSILPANTNQALAIIRDYDFNTDFLLTSLLGKAVASYIRKNPTIGAQPNLSLGQVSDLDICAPQVDEQRKIGTFFATLDRLITLHQRELTKLQNVKKSLLEKMFPPAGRVSV